MYRRVVAIEEREIFERLYTESFLEKNYETSENYKGDRMSYLVENELGEYIGTFELVKHNPSFDSILINPSLFLEPLKLLNAPLNNIWEVDKFTVKVSERKSGSLKRVVRSLLDVVEKANMEYLIAEMNPIFCRALKIEFKIEFIRIAPLIKTDKYPYIPIIIPISEEIQKTFINNIIK